MTTPPLSNTGAGSAAALGRPKGRQDCPQDNESACPQDSGRGCPQDRSARIMALKLAEEFRRGNVSRGQARRLSTGQVEIVFVLTDGSAYKTVNRTQAAADWMTKNRVLNRRQFFDGFPQANNSASLHNAALLLLGKHGKLRRRALGGYDWAEDVK